MKAPATLNGYNVIAAEKKRFPEDQMAVLVHRPGHFQPYVVATWSPALTDEWCWGHYYSSFHEAVEDFVSMTVRKVAA